VRQDAAARSHRPALDGKEYAVGFWGSFVVCRGETPLEDLAPVAEWSGALEENRRWAGGWQVGQYSGSAIADGAAALLPKLAARTGSPALIAFVLDSDAVSVEGCRPGAGLWRACLCREAMASYLKDSDMDLGAVFLPAREAARRAGEWAVAAGAAPDSGRLEHLFSLGHADPFAEELFFEMLESLGLRPL
jgi:hypothetical protein